MRVAAFKANAKGARAIAYVCLGSNQGDAVAHLSRACEAIAALRGVTILALSSRYRTEPQGLREQPFFINQAAKLACEDSVVPEALLASLQIIETALGRRRLKEKRFGPRTMDLDLLLFGDRRMRTPCLELPHPRMLERAFVLVPLAEIAPDLLLPQGMTVQNALERIVYTRRNGHIYQD